MKKYRKNNKRISTTTRALRKNKKKNIRILTIITIIIILNKKRVNESTNKFEIFQNQMSVDSLRNLFI